ncbi:hypothetical protein EVAR_38286_1 [Eumeta japonica]|uniref:Uncharacterized protein n=1 Tax=Eumeta variegata TaxID=151549 RepID=A0A4C1WAL0_EUMVA|nr:hypothetical protein EVAR_38286_1 [Eumeta japonica]
MTADPRKDPLKNVSNDMSTKDIKVLLSVISSIDINKLTLLAKKFKRELGHRFSRVFRPPRALDAFLGPPPPPSVLGSRGRGGVLHVGFRSPPAPEGTGSTGATSPELALTLDQLRALFTIFLREKGFTVSSNQLALLGKNVNQAISRHQEVLQSKGDSLSASSDISRETSSMPRKDKRTAAAALSDDSNSASIFRGYDEEKENNTKMSFTKVIQNGRKKANRIHRHTSGAEHTSSGGEMEVETSEGKPTTIFKRSWNSESDPVPKTTDFTMNTTTKAHAVKTAPSRQRWYPARFRAVILEITDETKKIFAKDVLSSLCSLSGITVRSHTKRADHASVTVANYMVMWR